MKLTFHTCCMNAFSLLVTYGCILIITLVGQPTSSRVSHDQCQCQVGHILPKAVVEAVLTCIPNVPE